MASFYLLFSLLLLPLLLLLKSKYTHRLKAKHRRPPGPWTLPVIGSIHHLIGRGLPHHALCSLSRQYGDLMFLQLGELEMVVVSSKEAAREVMKTQDLNFCNRPANPVANVLTYDGKDIAFAPYGEHWRKMRKICVLELLSTKRVQSFRSIREDEVKNLVEKIRLLSSAGQFFNLSERFLMLANDVTLTSIMGSKTKEQDLLLKEMQNCIKLTAHFGISNLFPSSRLSKMFNGAVRSAEKSRDRINQIFQNIMNNGQSVSVDGDAENLLAVLLRIRDEESENNQISMDDIKAIIFDMFAAGTDTSGATLEWVMAELMKNPRVMKKLQNELRQHLHGSEYVTESDLGGLHYMHLVIKEALRFHPPGPFALRQCRETCNLLGYDIPKGTLVSVNAWALGRDPRYWENAEEFRPERFAEAHSDMQFNGADFEFLPFGAGRRICPGISFGLSTLELALANLLYHFNWELPAGTMPHALDMTEAVGVTVRKRSPLYLRAIPYTCEC